MKKLSFVAKGMCGIIIISTFLATAAVGKQVTVRWFMRWDRVRLENVAIPVAEAFEKANPGIKVEIENIGSGSEYWVKLQTMIAGGVPPDVCYPATHCSYPLSMKGALLNLDPFIERDGMDINEYVEQIVDLYRYEGSLYGLPIDTAALVVFYNQDVFDKVGVAYPEDSWTWDDMLVKAIKLTKDFDKDGRIDQFGVNLGVYGGSPYWSVPIWSFTGEAIYDDLHNPTKCRLDSPKAIEALEFINDLTNRFHVMATPAESAGIGDQFLAGNLAMNMVGHWRVPRYMPVTEFKWNIAPLPNSNVNRSDGSCFAIPVDAEHPEEAWELVKFLAGPDSEGVKALLRLQQMTPALKAFRWSDEFLSPAALPDLNKKAFLAGEELLLPLYEPLHPRYAEISKMTKNVTDQIWTGRLTPAEAVEKLMPEINKILKEMQEEY